MPTTDFLAKRPPADLSDKAKAEWKRVMRIGEFRRQDAAALLAYVEAYANYHDAMDIIRREGQIVKDPIVSRDGRIVGERTKRHPATILARDWQQLMIRSGNVLGLFKADPEADQ